MGNVASVKLKEDTKPLMITEKLVRDFQYHIKLVDHSMAAFVRTTESLRKTFSRIRPSEEIGSNLNDGAGGEESDKAADCMAILEKIDGMLSDQSFIVTDSLSRLLHFIIETGNTTNIAIPDHILLLIDKYRSDTFEDVSEKDMQYHDVILESLRKKLVSANDRYRIARDEINNLNNREDHYQAEKRILQDTIYSHEVGAAEMKEELDKIRNEQNNLRRKNMDMQKEMFTLKNKIENTESNLSSGKLELQALHRDFKSQQDENINNVQEIQEHKQNINNLQEKLNEKNSKIESLEADLQNERQKAESFEKEKLVKIESLESEKQQMSNDYKKLKTLNDLDTKRFEELFKEVRDFVAESKEEFKAIGNTMMEYQIENRKHLITHETKHKTNVSEEISKVNKKLDEVNESMVSFSSDLTKINNERTYLKTENTRLSSCLGQSKNEEENWNKALNLLADEFREAKEKKSSLLLKIDDLEKENKQLEEKVNSSPSTGQKEYETLDKCHLEIKTLAKKIEEHFHRAAVASENKQKELVSYVQTGATDLGQKYIELKEFLLKEKEHEDKNWKEMQLPRKEVDERSRQIQYLQKELTKLMDEKEKSNEEIFTLKLKLECASKKKICVQVFRHSNFKARNIEKTLQDALTLRLIPENIELKCLDATDAYLLKSDFPVLVLCSRINTLNRDKNIANIAKAFKETKMNTITAMVFFHDKDQKNFKKEEVGKGSSSCRSFCDIFDIVYTKDGMFDCDENDTNIDNICEFLKEVCQTKSNEEESF